MPYTRRLLLGRECLVSLTLPPVKARWGRETRSRAGGDRKAARRAVPVGDAGALRASTAERGVSLPPKQAANSVHNLYTGQRRLLMSRCGGSPNMRLYSRLNWVTLS